MFALQIIVSELGECFYIWYEMHYSAVNDSV